MFVRARDTAANVMYYAMGGSGSFLRRESLRLFFSVDDAMSIKCYELDFGTIMLQIMPTSALAYCTLSTFTHYRVRKFHTKANKFLEVYS